jgi:Ca-activated chloride channel homolog
MPSMPPDESFSPHEPARRRQLLFASASLLALGVALNVDRLSPADPVQEELGLELEESAQWQASGHRHRGEEGRMGRPTSKHKSGLYSMKGPQFAVPGGAASIGGGDDGDVWGGLTGSETGSSLGASGLGLVGTGRGGGGTGEGILGLGTGQGHYLVHPHTSGSGGRSAARAGKRYRRPIAPIEPVGGTHALPPEPTGETGFITVAKDPRSTFSVDVDTASYSAVRQTLLQGQLPQADAVRIEELVNYFDYDYAPPTGDVPFSVTAEVGECPWNPEHELVHVGLQGKVIAPADLPPRNLVFLVDVSGSMSQPTKLPLVKQSLLQLTESLRAVDRIALVVYAGAAGVVLPPTPGTDKSTIRTALQRLSAGGSTNGEEGILAAYAQARAAFMKDGVNRVILASDGDFNVGVASHKGLVKLIEKQRKTGIELSVLGYGMGHRDHTMEQLADKGNGNYAYIDGPEEAHKVLVEEAGGTLVTIAKDVKIQVELDPARVLSYRLVGYENRRLAHADFADDTKDAGEIGAGHSVTALYEVVPQPQAVSADAPWMTVQLRYKPPKGDESRLLALPVVAEPRALPHTSEDFRFAAAVATYGMLLRGSEQKGNATWASTQALAEGALGDDLSCRRHRFVELVGKAGALAGDEGATGSAPACTIGRGGVVEPEVQPEPVVHDSPRPAIERTFVLEPVPTTLDDVGAWVLEVLRLLPPLLALPLFVMALRRPRRRTAAW